LETYSADEDEQLTEHDNPSTSEDITQRASDGERNSGANGPTARDPCDIFKTIQRHTNLGDDLRRHHEA
jgi:hypothetical protein